MNKDKFQDKYNEIFQEMKEEKMNWNFERYGDFIGKALKGQEEVLEEVATENILLLLEKFL